MLSAWSGGFGRPLTDDRVLMPADLELHGSRLVYSGEGRFHKIRLDRLLDDFLGLADQFVSARDAFGFARKYGPLKLCEHHGIAAYHKPLLMNRSSPLGPAPIFGVDEPFTYDWCGPRVERRSPEVYSEGVEAWFALARRAQDLLRVASAVRTEGDAPADLWEKADGFKGSFKERDGLAWAYLDNPWNRLAANLDRWILSADMTLRVRAEQGSLVAALGANPSTYSPFALITMQLVLAVLRAEGLASCAGCGTPFVSSRPPLAGKLVGPQVAKRNYCRSCRDAKIPQRHAARDYRRRQGRRHVH